MVYDFRGILYHCVRRLNPLRVCAYNNQLRTHENVVFVIIFYRTMHNILFFVPKYLTCAAANHGPVEYRLKSSADEMWPRYRVARY